MLNTEYKTLTGLQPLSAYGDKRSFVQSPENLINLTNPGLDKQQTLKKIINNKAYKSATQQTMPLLPAAGQQKRK